MFDLRKPMRQLSVLLFLAGFASAAAAQTTLLFNLFIPRTHSAFTEVLDPWAQRIAKATEGRVRIEFSASSLAPIPRQFDMVRNGVADLALDQTIFNASRFELAKIAEFPFVTDSTEAASVALWRTYEKHFATANEYDGVKVLSLQTSGPAYLWTSKKRIARLDDLKGLKIRMSGVYVRELAGATSVVPIAEPGPKAYELVSNGVVDGSAFTTADIQNFKLSDQLRNMLYMPGGMYTATFALILNQAKWDKLSPQDQAILMKESGEAYATLSGRAWDKANARARTELMAAGVQETRLDAESMAELERRLAPIRSGWVAAATKKGVDGNAALEFFRAQVGAIERASR